MAAPARRRDNPLTRSRAGLAGLITLIIIGALCVGTLPWTAGAAASGSPRYAASDLDAARLPPLWAPHDARERERLAEAGRIRATAALARELGVEPADAPEVGEDAAAAARPRFWLGSDALGRDLLTRVLAGGGVSLGIGLAASLIAVAIGTVYGMVAGYAGGRVDAVMMRIVDILYGLPYILLVVLLAVAVDSIADAQLSGAVERAQRERAAFVERELAALPEALRGDEEAVGAIEREAATRFGWSDGADSARTLINIVTLLVAIGGVSWLTMARVIRGQVLSLRAQPFVEAARAVGAPTGRIFRRHLLPNLVGPIIVYATLTAPQAILQESFLSFLGIGVMQPVPSWGNLAAEGLAELNTVRARWWLLLFPCAMLGVTLLALNFVGEGLREAMDPRRSRS